MNDREKSANGGNRIEFRLANKAMPVVAAGLRKALVSGAIDTLSARCVSFFRDHRDGPAILVGALPFDRRAADFLYQPAEFTRVYGLPKLGNGATTAGVKGRLIAEPPADAYARAVSASLALMAEDGMALAKVVLSRSLRLEAASVDLFALMRRLGADPLVTTFLTPLCAVGNRWLVGATPELLVSKRGEEVLSHPLAGSARRDVDPQRDRQSGEALLASDKDRREHRMVAETILDVLAPLCAELSAPEGMTLSQTASMWHLGTRIRGRLRDRDTPVAELLARLHPTPAVCGLPRERAAQVIAALEGYDRGFYAGAVGWMDAGGDGDWYVSLRCAEVAGRTMRLFAGAGIVPGSDPAAETDETSAKFQAILAALGMDENGRALSEDAA
ncbi:isochorismate synthase [Rhizobium sp. YJ-22]|uniref:isochorismate synthase n=1 Tax=Rhizobium sp. YJ-22 TaxID=3037556 RepID=UPI002412AB8D|nr:isochorismate synthase [Rhizobium sp. YJ-22]MDG3578057.1 isochorismate synthase [Rhizobium sp. YJ-22]